MYTMIKLGRMLLIGSISIGCTMIKLGQMVLKGVNWVYNDKIR